MSRTASQRLIGQSENRRYDRQRDHKHNTNMHRRGTVFATGTRRAIGFRLAGSPLRDVVLSDRFNDGRLRAFIARRFREAHFLTDREFVEVSTLHTIAMEVDLTPVRCRDEPVVAFGHKCTDDAIRRHFMHLDAAFAFAHEILQLPPCLIEGIGDRGLYLFMPAGSSRVAADGYVRCARNSQMNANGIGVPLVMSTLGASDHDTSRSYPIAELLELPRLLSNPLPYEVRGIDVLKLNLQRNLHGGALHTLNQNDNRPAREEQRSPRGISIAIHYRVGARNYLADFRNDTVRRPMRRAHHGVIRRKPGERLPELFNRCSCLENFKNKVVVGGMTKSAHDVFASE